MGTLVSLFSTVSTILATYPAISTTLVSLGVVVAAFFGLNITGDQLIYVVGVVMTLAGLLIHSNVMPMIRARVTGATSATADKTVTPAVVTAETRIDKVMPNV
jgi:hypothetical protein